MPPPVRAEDLRADVMDQLYLEPGEFTDEDDLVGFGLDSLRLLTLADIWRERYGVAVAFEELAEATNVAAWAGMLGGASPGAGPGPGAGAAAP